jgi:hypothetical protein
MVYLHNETHLDSLGHNKQGDLLSNVLHVDWSGQHFIFL